MVDYLDVNYFFHKRVESSVNTDIVPRLKGGSYKTKIKCVCLFVCGRPNVKFKKI